MKKINQAVILAGGLGTRLKPFTLTNPKPMYKIYGKPFLEYLIIKLKYEGISEVVLLLGYLSEIIVDYFKDGKDLGIKIKYSISSVDDLTGERLKKSKKLLSDRFILLYCDNYWPLNLKKMTELFNSSDCDAQLTVYNNSDNYSKNNLQIDENNLIKKYDKSRLSDNLNGLDIGFIIMKKNVVDLIPDGNVSFEEIVYENLIERKKLTGFKTDHRYYSIGSIERIKLTKQFFSKKPTIILDRDGVLNVKPSKADYVKNIKEWTWIDGSIKAISLLKKNGYRIIIVSNQAGISRGMMSENDLNNIHDSINNELKKNDACIDKIYFCPHGWDDNCDCRKPKPGMLFQAQRDFNIDLTETYFIGDDIRDKQASKKANSKFFMVDNTYKLIDFVNEYII